MNDKEEIMLLKTVVETQKARIAEQEILIKEFRETIEDLRSLKANFEETLQETQHQMFGTRSEKTKAGSVKQDDSQKEEGKAVTVKAHTRERRSKSKRDELYTNLPVREIVCPVPESERNCDYCNAEMIPIGS